MERKERKISCCFGLLMSVLLSFILRMYIFLWKFMADAKSLFLYGAEDPYARWAILFLKHRLTTYMLYIAYYSCSNCVTDREYEVTFAKGPLGT
jgi:hypothetical protein